MIFVIILGCMLWYTLGMIGVWSIEDEFDDLNPLWDILIVLAGPISILIWIGIRILKSIQSYMKRVKSYYKRKRERCGMEERMKMRRSVWGDN